MKLVRPEDVNGPLDYRELSAEEMKEVYALAHAAFTIEDLLRYTEVVEEFPAEDVLREMEEAQEQADRRTA